MTSPGSGNPVALQCPQCGANLRPNMAGYAVCEYCGSSVIWNQGEAATGRPQEGVVRGMRLKLFTVTDTEGTGLELFRILMPVGWEFQGGCRWLLDNPGMPATVDVQLWNPQGAEMFAVLPNINFTWNNNPLTRLFSPTGSRYFGAEVREPMGIQEALRELVLPRYRSEVQGLQILNEELVPALPRLVKSEAPISGGSAEGGDEQRLHQRRLRA